MDLLTALQQNFVQRFGRQPQRHELADYAQAAAVFLYIDANFSPPQIQQRLQQMLTPGTALNTNFLVRFK